METLKKYITKEELKPKIEEEINTTNKAVNHILKKSEKARNEDTYLILRVLKLQGTNIKLYKEKEEIKINIKLKYEEMNNLTSFETITRCRRNIQNTQGKHLPTDPHIIHQRRIKEEIIREYYGKESNTYKEWSKL